MGNWSVEERTWQHRVAAQGGRERGAFYAQEGSLQLGSWTNESLPDEKIDTIVIYFYLLAYIEASYDFSTRMKRSGATFATLM